MSDTIRIVYAGTPDFAVPALSALIASEHEVVAVYTQPDRPAGRGREPRPSPVKRIALEQGVPVFQPESLKLADDQAVLRELDADLMVVAAYGLLLPKAVLQIPRLGCINIHASLLPRWRGAAPIQRAILAGDSVTGITIMQMDEGLDTGAMLARAECDIAPEDTGASLHDRMMQLGGQVLMATLPALLRNEIVPEPQDESLATYASKLNKQEADIDWTQAATQIERSVHAYNAWPVAFTQWRRKNKLETLRVWSALVTDTESRAAPGSVLLAGRDGIDVATGAGVLRLLQVQPAGKRLMSAADFVNAYSLEGQVLGSR